MITSKPSAMKKGLKKAKEDADYLKKLNRAYVASFMSFSEDNEKLKVDLAVAMKGLLTAIEYEKALKMILELVTPHVHLRTCNEVALAARAALGPVAEAAKTEEKPKKNHCNNRLQCIQTYPPGVIHKPSCICICPGCKP